MTWRRSPWLRYGLMVLAATALTLAVLWGLLGWLW